MGECREGQPKDPGTQSVSGEYRAPCSGISRGRGTFGTLKTKLVGFLVSDSVLVSTSERSESLTIPIATANQ